MFPIRYYRVKNGGKHRAINKGTDLAQGELFFIVDSDDYLTEDALELIDKWIQTIPKNERFCGISGNRGKSTDSFIGTTFDGDYIDATSLERHKYNITGDKAEVFLRILFENTNLKNLKEKISLLKPQYGIEWRMMDIKLDGSIK